jgi:hypothetical protein
MIDINKEAKKYSDDIKRIRIMNNKQTVDLVNIIILIFGLCFMFIPQTKEIILLGIGFFVSSILNLLFNNIKI